MRRDYGHRCAHRRIGKGLARLVFCLLLLAGAVQISATPAFAAEKTVRLRFAWGSGTAAKHRWTGSIAINGGVLTELQPLGIEVDAPVATRIDGTQLVVAPLEKRGFDGCDITVQADEQARVRVELRSEQTPQSAVIESTLAAIADGRLREPLDEFGSFFLAHRSPGDRLRVVTSREHWVFQPNEQWQLSLQPDLADALAAGPVMLDVQLRAIGESKSQWQTSQRIEQTDQQTDSLHFDIPGPAVEGAYRLSISARPEEGFATRLVPGQQVKPIAQREVEFVVIDPAANLPNLADQWQPVLTIDPANPRWWQRLPDWAQVPRLRNLTSGAVGNVRPVVRPTPTGEIVELPPATEGVDPAWQAYTLPVRAPGQPHLIEIEYPKSANQHLAISLVEPDAAGKVVRTEQDATLVTSGVTWAATGEIAVHRFLVWPRTNSPQLLIVNRHPTAPGSFGKIRLLKQQEQPSPANIPPADQTRLVAAYLSKPLLANCFGAAEVLDPASGLSVQSWKTFLEGTQRLVQSLRLRGYNGLMIAVSADGSGLYPSPLLNPSPRYDTGMLASSGQDPSRKDVLEMLLRICDREGIRVVPTIQLAAPLPRLEAFCADTNSESSGIRCLGYQGQSWLAEQTAINGLAPYYNPLHQSVQAELAALVAELTDRYQSHQSFTGVGVQVSGEGYGMLPGLEWCLDDMTASEFTRDTGVELSALGAERFRQRAQVLLGPQRNAWQQWRTEKITQLYQQLAQRITATRSDLQLVLASEDVFAGEELQRRVRQTIAEPANLRQVLLDHGLDMQQLAAQPQTTVCVAHRLSTADDLQHQSIDIRVNSAALLGDVVPTEQATADQFFSVDERFRLTTFDQLSPFGPEHSFLTVTSQPTILQRQPLATSLAVHDSQLIAIGGSQPSGDVDPQTIHTLRAWQQLPDQSAQVRSEREQPVVMRVCRTSTKTIVVLINEAPWPVNAQFQVDGTLSSSWHKLGHDSIDAPTNIAGTITSSDQPWDVQLQPYDIQAWQFADPKLRVDGLQVQATEVASQDLTQRIAAIESRAGNLNIQRPFSQLQNPSFELVESGVRIVGWQPRFVSSGSIALSAEKPNSGTQALRLQSQGETGVAVQSHLFSVPETGHLTVRMFVRANQFDEDAQLQLAVEDADGGRRYLQYATLTKKLLTQSDWAPYELTLNDIPFDQNERLRLRFQLSGEADVLIDDVELYDLRFDDARRRALVKRIYAAKIALEQGQVVDCLRVVDDYWSRYLVEHVPPLEETTLQATKPQTQSTPTVQKPEPGFGSKLRNLAPKKWW